MHRREKTPTERYALLVEEKCILSLPSFTTNHPFIFYPLIRDLGGAKNNENAISNGWRLQDVARRFVRETSAARGNTKLPISAANRNSSPTDCNLSTYLPIHARTLANTLKSSTMLSHPESEVSFRRDPRLNCTQLDLITRSASAAEHRNFKGVKSENPPPPPRYNYDWKAGVSTNCSI